MPTVSICMPSRNQARFLPQTLDSALAQTFQDFEIIIVDDGSTDESPAIHQQYAARYPERITALTHPEHAHLGISATTNRALDHASGELIVILDSDDLWRPDTLERRLHFMRKNPEIALMATHYDLINEHNEIIRQKAAPDLRDDCKNPFLLTHRLILGCDIGNPTIMLRRDALRHMQAFDETLIHGDWELWVRIASRHSVGFLPEVTALHRRHQGNITGAHTMQEELARRLAVMNALRQKAPADPGHLAHPRLRALIELEICCYLFCLSRRPEAEQHLRAALATDPTLLADGGHYFSAWLSQRPLLAQPREDFHAWIPEQLRRISI
ncbi:MAG: glycosyltransferase [Kiritimatiellae bacterium]|nr:glycosyltransferase [Kiritimatiellia bacterium]MDD4737248.1 glycosyltransferase [Kiritimatiellia bacterium]